MPALIWRKIAWISFCVPLEWEWSASAQRKGQTCCWMRAWRRACMHGCSKRWAVSLRGRPCWVSQLCFTSSEEVPAANNAVPDHGVNSLIFNAALHYVERSRLFQRHPLARRRIRRGNDRKTLVSHSTRYGRPRCRWEKLRPAIFYIYLAFLVHFDENIVI